MLYDVPVEVEFFPPSAFDPTGVLRISLAPEVMTALAESGVSQLTVQHADLEKHKLPRIILASSNFVALETFDANGNVPKRDPSWYGLRDRLINSTSRFIGYLPGRANDSWIGNLARHWHERNVAKFK